MKEEGSQSIVLPVAKKIVSNKLTKIERDIKQILEDKLCSTYADP